MDRLKTGTVARPELPHTPPLNPFRGPWSAPQGRRRGSLPLPFPPVETAGSWESYPGFRGTPFTPGERVARRIQECLEAWRGGVDRESPAPVARWIRATREAEGACRSLLRGRV